MILQKKDNQFKLNQICLIGYAIILSFVLIIGVSSILGYFITFTACFTFIIFSILGTYISVKNEKVEKAIRQGVMNYQRTSSIELHKQWPTRKFERIVDKFRPSDNNYTIANNRPSCIRDVSEDAAHMLIDFLPDISMFGIDLWFDHKLYYEGVFARALEYDSGNGSKELCLQYILAYTRQANTISVTSSIIFPFLIFISQFFFDYAYLIILWSPLIMFGIYHLRKHPKDPFTTFNSILPIILYIGILLNPIFLLLMIVLLLGFVVTSLVSLLDIPNVSTKLGIHHLDYAPVFIWLRKDRNPEPFSKWIIDFACWDKWHYKTKIEHESDLVFTKKKDYNHIKEETRIRLIMEDLWHSFRAGTQEKKSLGLLYHFCLIWVFHAPVFVPFLYLFLIQGVNEMTLVFGLYFISLVSAGLTITSGPFNVNGLEYKWIYTVLPNYSDPSRIAKARAAWPFLNMVHLSDGAVGPPTLEILWNLRDGIEDDSPSLKIINKIQDPFTPKNNGSFTSFKDS